MWFLPRRTIQLLAFSTLVLQQSEKLAAAPAWSVYVQQSERRSSQLPSSQTQAPANPPVSSSLRDQAWSVLQSGASADKVADRAAAVHATGLVWSSKRAREMAEAGLKDNTPAVRAAAAAALGEMGARASISKLKTATEDKDASVALAAGHALLLLHDDFGYNVFYEVLTGERRTGKGPLSEAAALKDPKKLAELGFQEALGFIPYAGIGWSAFKAVRKNDTSPARAAAAIVLEKDRDPNTTEALVQAAGDKNWIVRAAALEALAKRGNSSVLGTVQLYLTDQEGEVKYTAAAAVLRLSDIRDAKGKKKK